MAESNDEKSGLNEGDPALTTLGEKKNGIGLRKVLLMAKRVVFGKKIIDQWDSLWTSPFTLSMVF